MSLPNQQPRYKSTIKKLGKLTIPSSFLLLFGCNTTSLTSESSALETANNDCIGKVEQHTGLVPLQDEKLPSGVVMPQQLGGLCKGQVFVTTQEITIWRAWNSEYRGSKLGKWWTFDKPRGSISQYRRDNVICPSYSPLDMLVSCKIKVGTHVVVGPGQSAKCSDYFSYPASPTNQIYLAEASNTTLECQSYKGQFSWRKQPNSEAKLAESL
ncbi:hypothetical protein [Pseudoalteromonas luteoviolacea]|uniref:Uncharacterized protein n=1 Tax=Pseudoalteromonas luteoviolacea S4054 TaxID=1129367 RepID=A0A0F6A8I8_9GAMM|nr:hypothetical protein [Pseudoalteromonas luteoviolacea]AOT10406.1 hypothetical protein S4054249_21275 [Pseudoalteromonas luteoviolacea]AOT15524.1 hypothetical protein S40542_22315 [Pseudoalteromonas luteoviolacea]AOT20225.1 hypothetical protein S4054_21190 [Pseudoalteromonas luteoviolacea]KKE82171.1 hypothetical protein N479_19400 [Pseudoalteromonas luteoviolacea S4054]KZN69693.1 hypothetical protein N481_21835 [Pseudoalteromonas luteoviolacea S4047-1]